MDRGNFSFQGKIVFFNVILVSITLLTSSVAFFLLPFWWAFAVALVVVIPSSLVTSYRFASPLAELINALIDSTDNIKDQEFSVTIATTRTDELGLLVHRHNEIAQRLREERHNINQRELLLDTVLQSTPIAMLLCDDRDRVVYSNLEARQLLAEGKRLQGAKLGELLVRLDEDLASAIRGEKEGLISVESSGEIESYYLSCRFFSLNSRIHKLHLIRRMTREISRQEVTTWKRVIRLISHELNNSLAPISSLSHSGKIAMSRLQSHVSIAESQQDWLKLTQVLTTIGERASHLKDFIEGYARFARLPTPRIKSFDLHEMLARLAQQLTFEVIVNDQKLEVQLDQTQFEQVLINLVKNARDAAGQEGLVQVAAERRGAYLLLIVADDGPGMTNQVMQQALLPFYSTKQDGTGLGLPLCREIVEAHGGQLSIRNTAGFQVVLRIPQGSALLKFGLVAERPEDTG